MSVTDPEAPAAAADTLAEILWDAYRAVIGSDVPFRELYAEKRGAIEAGAYAVAVELVGPVNAARRGKADAEADLERAKAEEARLEVLSDAGGSEQ